MLSYEQCAALKAAGFPQNTSRDWLMSCREAPGGAAQGEARWREHYGYDRPNSDELIAAIQQRWPSYEIQQSYDPNGGTIEESHHFSAWGGEGIGESHYIEHGTGNSPAAALCALYIALAAEGGRDG